MVLKLTFIVICMLNLILGFHHHHDSNGMEEAVRKADQQETNVTELMETNEGFRNLTNNGVPRKRVVGIISAVTAGIGLLKGIANQIDVGRVCVIGLSNHGNRKLIEPTWYLQHGIIHDPLPREIAPGDAGVFTFEKTQYSVFGTSGILSYTVEGTDLQVEVLWSVPIFYGPESNIFNVEIEENTEASIMTYKYFFNNDFQKVSNGGHWMHRNHDNIQVHAAMTNNAKASLLVEVFYNLTSSVNNPFGK